VRRDLAKFDDMVEFARRCRRCATTSANGSRWGTSRGEHVLACAVRLLELGFFRIGSEDYAVRNETTAWPR
jgi:DNA topoisomerase IB